VNHIYSFDIPELKTHPTHPVF